MTHILYDRCLSALKGAHVKDGYALHKEDVDFVRAMLSSAKTAASFIFPPVDFDNLAKFGDDLAENNLFRLPFSDCFFQFEAAGEPEKQCFMFLCQCLREDRPEWCGAWPDDVSGKILALLMHEDESGALIFYGSMVFGMLYGSREWTFQPHMCLPDDPSEREAARFMLWLMSGAVGLLASRGVQKTEVKPRESVNKKRIARGQTPFPAYTIIKLNQEFQKTSQNGHASPRPHWRRGHIRRIGEDGRITMVRPHPVMAEAGAPNKTPYRISL